MGVLDDFLAVCFIGLIYGCPKYLATSQKNVTLTPVITVGADFFYKLVEAVIFKGGDCTIGSNKGTDPFSLLLLSIIWQSLPISLAD